MESDEQDEDRPTPTDKAEKKGKAAEEQKPLPQGMFALMILGDNNGTDHLLGVPFLPNSIQPRVRNKNMPSSERECARKLASF